MRLFLILAALLFSCDAAAATQCGIASQTCSSGPATVNIDGMEVTRPCWRNTIEYACIEDGATDTCSAIAAKGCDLKQSVCTEGVTAGGALQCITEQREYACKTQAASSSTAVDCGAQQFCIEGHCFDTGAVPDPDFAKAVAGMEVAREAGVYVDEETFQVFKGHDSRCAKSALKNCCKDASKSGKDLTNLALAGGSAYAFDILSGGGMKSTLVLGADPAALALVMSAMVVQEMQGCDKEDVLVALKRNNRLCHHVGDYCSRRIRLGLARICVQRKETHCCFNSKISRLINEAARMQLPGLGWGTPEAPSCQGITIAQFQAIDLSTVDFSDFYADIVPTAPNEGDVRRRAAQKVDSYFGK
ncbi:conjugal transfer protein TraN [Duganella sp. FT27W]|uniref:conjugal transfer protein TraN n=1 Tax=Duganella sp. FT27W TaxID=2654636 RepID=UPI00128D9673|nr:conjugal transfer protein TraN [Duganella sp. FT27W]MPQ55124.1 hypothetical protein [Duganella sp. FT27W]